MKAFASPPMGSEWTLALDYDPKNTLMYGFISIRLAHTVAFATKQSHEVRATLYTVGSAVVIIMAVYVIASVV